MKPKLSNSIWGKGNWSAPPVARRPPHPGTQKRRLRPGPEGPVCTDMRSSQSKVGVGCPAPTYPLPERGQREPS